MLMDKQRVREAATSGIPVLNYRLIEGLQLVLAVVVSTGQAYAIPYKYY
jgi:Flp pilus assembly protein CpaB